MTLSDEERVRGLLHLLGLARHCLYLPAATPEERDYWRAEIQQALGQLAEIFLSDPHPQATAADDADDADAATAAADEPADEPPWPAAEPLALVMRVGRRQGAGGGVADSPFTYLRVLPHRQERLQPAAFF